MPNHRLMQTAAAGAAGGEFLAIEDVFSTYLYTGNGSTQTITNGIDLAGEGGMVWIKKRANLSGTGVGAHLLYDTERGAGKHISTNNTNAEATNLNLLSSLNSDGFTVGANSQVNGLSDPIASWTFRKAPRFFDVVTWTGNGNTGARSIPHNLGSVPGAIIGKRTDSTGGWRVYHRNLSLDPNGYETQSLILNSTSAEGGYGFLHNHDQQTDTYFTTSGTGGVSDWNVSGATYVAYLFAHDPLGPSGDGSDGLIACGTYTGVGSGTVEVDIGWEPQWLLIKNATSGSASCGWFITDVQRGMAVSVGSNTPWLRAESASSESTTSLVYPPQPLPNGFRVQNDTEAWNQSGQTYIYIAIRRGPMRQPESGTEVFGVTRPVETTGEELRTQSGVLPDAVLHRFRLNQAQATNMLSRVTGDDRFLQTNTTGAETDYSAFGLEYWKFDNNDYAYVSWNEATNNQAGNAHVAYSFRRAPGFFDVVAYTGNGVAGRTVPHNLGVAPELMIVKRRDGVSSWITYWESLGATKGVFIDTNAPFTSNTYWNDTAPTDSVFSLGSGSTNTSSATFISYLFATVPGVSKVGSYTGNGTSQTIDCGFTSGARFVMTKRTNTTGNWNVWDSERGIVAGNDPRLELNTTDAEDTGHDYIDPASSGFTVNYVADDDDDSNVDGDEYIFLAIA